MSDLTKFHYHELIDRTSLIETMFDQFVLDTEVIESHPELLEIATRISDDLGALYQALGSRPEWL